MNVALVEKDTIGGTCLNRGCIPAKAFLESSAVFRHVAHAKDFGVESSAPTVNFAVTQARKQTIVNGLVKGLTGLTKSKKVTYILGTGSLGAGGRYDAFAGWNQCDFGGRIRAPHDSGFLRWWSDHDIR
jgi:dihydrolipoamide dehydrogenase